MMMPGRHRPGVFVGWAIKIFRDYRCGQMSKGTTNSRSGLVWNGTKAAKLQLKEAYFMPKSCLSFANL